MRSGCLHDRPHTRRVCARRETGFGRCPSPRGTGTQDSAGACPPCGDRHLGVLLCLCQRLVMRHHGGVFLAHVEQV
ncbi:hypothetical protein L530_1756, partial [Bordetella bronchiseptica MO211]